MNIKINPPLWALLIIITCLISGCNIVPGLKHYVPPEGSNLGIEFDYPRNWKWVYRSKPLSIDLFEPDKPVYISGETPASSDAGVISIGVEVGISPERQDERIKSWLEATDSMEAEVLEDKMIEIDGVSARWMTSRIPERSEANPDFELYTIAVFVYENHNLYDLILEIPFERREGEFVHDFTKMISTIEFVP